METVRLGSERRGRACSSASADSAQIKTACSVRGMFAVLLVGSACLIAV